MQSKAATIEQYLAELPEDRRAALQAVRKVILKNIDKTYQEGMGYGMMGWSVPHSVYPHGYHCDPRQPLPFAGLASQKNHLSLYVMGLYCGCVPGTQDTGLVKWFHDAWKKSGKKLDMGKSCIRFKKAEDLALDVVGELIRRMPAKKYIEVYEDALQAMGKGPDGKPLKDKSAAKKGGAKKAAKKTRKSPAAKTKKSR